MFFFVPCTRYFAQTPATIVLADGQNRMLEAQHLTNALEQHKVT